MQIILDLHQPNPRQAEEAQAFIEAEKREIALYEEHRDHVSYGFYVARKR